MKKGNIIKKELKEHIPFTGLATIIAVILIALTLNTIKPISETLFEVFHPLHVVVSAFVTTAIYYKYKNKIIPAILIGIVGAILIGTLSDVILPHLEANLLQLHTHFHLPIIEEPLIILSSAIIGSIFGIAIHKTKLPHFLHVFLSVFASLFYIIAYSTNLTMLYLILTSIIVFIAVIIPCCLSDIVFPLIFIKKK